ncbi:hypothetical protein JOF35_004569 [Streptomyces demainii]|uniref:Uncharacterized protein n=1 Tax=Streptomyces demainii TaxID=588122 RepID=A0ABT9KXQ8_9ACTN|nr:hypothetical protein [Streptomyces demainii]
MGAFLEIRSGGPALGEARGARRRAGGMGGTAPARGRRRIRGDRARRPHAADRCAAGSGDVHGGGGSGRRGTAAVACAAPPRRAVPPSPRSPQQRGTAVCSRRARGSEVPGGAAEADRRPPSGRPRKPRSPRGRDVPGGASRGRGVAGPRAWGRLARSGRRRRQERRHLDASTRARSTYSLRYSGGVLTSPCLAGGWGKNHCARVKSRRQRCRTNTAGARRGPGRNTAGPARARRPDRNTAGRTAGARPGTAPGGRRQRSYRPGEGAGAPGHPGQRRAIRSLSAGRCAWRPRRRSDMASPPTWINGGARRIVPRGEAVTPAVLFSVCP